MSSSFLRGELERFRSLVAERLGLQVEDDRLDGLATVLRARMESAGADRADAYLERLVAPSTARGELRALARELTVGETYFLRNVAQLHALVEIVLPSLGRGAGACGELRILSAGCSSGDEAYSIAISMRERTPDLAPLARIHAVDASPTALEKAAAARYSVWSLRETPDELRARYFVADGRDLVLAEGVRRMVSFEERNLVEEDPLFWRPDAFHVVFCRNVIMYFSRAAARAVVARITRSLAPGGHLFLGHAETLRGLSEDYDLCHTHETFYYRLREPSKRPAPPSPRAADAIAPPARDPPASPSDAWVGAIQRASDHIERLALRRGEGTPPPPAAPGPPAEPPGGGADLRAAMDLVQQERFTDALDHLRALPEASLADAGAQLLLAVLLTNAGDPREAEEACLRLLAVDPRSAGAHYLAALCRERAGDLGAAAEHDRAAAHFDPSFAMPRLHLGLLAKRGRDLDAARGELRRALFLLAREEASRLLLFGGGFHRDALLELCRAELRAMGG